MVRSRSGRFVGLRWAVVLVTTVVAVLMAPLAMARDARVVAVDVDPRVVDALVVALSPWSLTVVRAPGPLPSVEFDAATARARVVAADQQAGAVVWIAPPRPPEAQATLWVYDAETLELTVRPLSVWVPFDDAGAASVALTVKTILRDSPLMAPEPAPPPPAPVPPAPSPAPRAAPPAPEPAEPLAAWRFESLVGARGPTGTGAPLEALAALGASVWPAAFDGHGGLGLAVQAGPGSQVNLRTFQGELWSGALELTARLRGPVRRWFAFEVDAGPAVWLTSLAGRTQSPDTPIHALRVDPSIDLEGVAEVALAAQVNLGLTAGGAAMLRFQRYALDGAPLITQPAWIGLFGVRLSVGIH